MTMDSLAVEARSARGSRRVALALRANRAVVVVSVVWLLFMLNFTSFAFGSSDANVQYGLVRRLFGDASHASGYFFGVALLEAPFYALGKLLEAAGLHTIAGSAATVAAISVGMGLLVIPGIVLVAWILRRLRLPVATAVLFGAVFGTSFFYYGAFQPGKNHVADAVIFTALVALVCVWVAGDMRSTGLAAAIGATLGLSVAVRYFAGAEAIVLVAFLLWLRRWRAAAVVAGSAAATFVALALIPLGYDVSSFAGPNDNVLVFAPLNPLRMLVTDHRGLFTWTPVTLIALVGYVHLLRTRPEWRRFLALVGAMGIGIAASYAFVPWWDGTYSFGQRFLTPLFPLVAIGLAGAYAARPRLVATLTTLCVAWTVFLALNMQTIGGWMFFQERKNSATALAGLPVHDHYSVGSYLWGIYHQSRLVRSWLPWPGSTPAR